MRYLYTLLFYALVPWVLVQLLLKSRRQPDYRRRWGERFGFYAAPRAEGALWFHAVSVGECEAAFPLIQGLLKQALPGPLLVTCTTPTGSARILEVLGDRVLHVYLPYDLPDAVARFLDHFNPRLGVILETEIWPNLFLACHGRQVPLMLVNGRLSDKSVKGYRRVVGLTRQALASVHCIAAQTPLDAERYVAIGAPPDRVQVTGNVKFDIDFDSGMQARSARLRDELFPGRPVLIAGSTHPGEEELIIDAVTRIRCTVPELLLILAPRHPQRATEVRALCESRGLGVVNRSEQRPAARNTGIFLIDGIGELRAFYGAADVAFVGGSLVPHGGQNVLEAAVTGLPVLFGPYTMNFREITSQLLAAGGGVQVNDADQLAELVGHFIEFPAMAGEVGRKGRAFVAANRGAVAKVAELIAGLAPAVSPMNP